jgi:TolA-binding protein
MKMSVTFFKSLVGVLFVAGILLSCNENREKTRTEEALEQTGDAIREDAKDLADKIEAKTDSTGEEWENNKDQFVARMQQRSRELDSEIDELQQKIERQGKKADQKLKNQLAELEDKRDQLDVKMDQLRQSTGNAWQDMKAGIRRAADELDQGFRSAKENFEKDSVK